MDRETGNTKIEWICHRQKLEELRVEDQRNQEEKVSEKEGGLGYMSQKSQG